MNKFDKVFRSIIKESTDTQYVFDEVEFDRAFKRAWTSSDTQKMKQYFRKGMTVQEIKNIYRELCQKVSDGDYKGAYRAWTRVLTSGFLFRLMWELGYDCVVPNKFNGNNLEVKFTPHVASASTIKESYEWSPDNLDKEGFIKVNYKQIFDTMKEIIKSDRGAAQDLRSYLYEHASEYPETFYEDIFVGDEDGTVMPLIDPDTWKEFGFVLTEQQRKVLQDFFENYHYGKFAAFGDDTEDEVFNFLNECGFGSLNDIVEKRNNGDWD